MADKEEFSFMEEKIMESKKPKRRFIAEAKRMVWLGIIFGSVAGACFACVNGMISRNGETGASKEIETKTSVSPEESISATNEPEQTKNPKKKDEKTSQDVNNLQVMYEKLRVCAEEGERSIVGVSGYNGDFKADSFLSSGEQVSGVIVAQTENHLLILTSYNKVKGKEHIRVELFGDFAVAGKLYNYDERTDMAIIQIPVSQIDVKIKDKLSVMVLCDSNFLMVGDLLIALGNPNGSMYSMEFGYLTSKRSEESIEDYQLDLYTSNMGYHSEGYGFICNMKGEMIGIINNQNPNTEQCTFYGMSRIRNILDSLLQKDKLVYAGVVSETIPSDILLEYQLPAGVYVTKVDPDSPAYNAGILVGNVITEIDGTSVDTVMNYYNTLQKYEDGDQITMTVIQDPFGNQIEKKVKVEVVSRK